MEKFNITAAALATMMAFGVPTASAADAVLMVEPEPVSYVQLCDVYGAGWFYLPGSERCIKFGGDIRTEYVKTTKRDVTNGDVRWRGRFNVYAQEDTEIGTVSSRLRLAGVGDGHTGNAVRIDVATIALGTDQGVAKVGFGDSYWTTAHGYGFYKAANDGFYSYDRAAYLQVTSAIGPINATAGLQFSHRLDDNEPDFYVGVQGGANTVQLAGTLIYDSSREDLAWKVSGDWNASENFQLGAWYMGAGQNNNQYVVGTAAFGVRGNVSIDKWDVYAGYSDTNVTRGMATIGARYNVTNNLYISPEYSQRVSGNTNRNWRLRVVRSF